MSRPSRFTIVIGACTMLTVTTCPRFAAAQPKPTESTTAIPTRDRIAAEHTWNLDDLFKSEADWEAAFTRAQEMVQKCKSMKGMAAKSGADLLAVLKHRDETYLQVDRLAVYASLRQDEDLNNKSNQARFNRASELYNKFGESLAWFEPEVLQIPAETLHSWLEKDRSLAVYRHALDNIQRMRPHTLSPSEEELLAMSRDMSDGMQRTFSLLSNADLKFPTIKNEKGEDLELSSARYMGLIYSPDRRVRRDAFLGLHQTFEKFENTIGSLLTFQIKRAVFYARARKYNSAIEAALDGDNVPVAVYDHLIAAVHEAFPLMHRYMAMRKKLLKLDELHPYDLYVPMIAASQEKIEYDRAVETIIEALGVLGGEYVEPMKQGFSSRWIDVYATRGKRSGAYCSGTYSVHPYLLLNYEGTANDRSTVAHEMGHAMHTWFSTHHQPVIYGDYSIFCAEVASTVNEVILNHHLMQKATTKQQRLELVNSLLENIRTTVFRQTLFAEFERITHKMVEEGKPLTPDILQQIYRDLNRQYYGEGVVMDSEWDSECLRIPHFYSNFYVYKYATSYSAASDIGRRIIAGEPAARDGLLKFLKAGSSVYPIDCLKLAGVDMTTPEPVRNCMKLFGEKLDEMERLLAQ